MRGGRELASTGKSKAKAVVRRGGWLGKVGFDGEAGVWTKANDTNVEVCVRERGGCLSLASGDSCFH